MDWGCSRYDVQSWSSSCWYCESCLTLYLIPYTKRRPGTVGEVLTIALISSAGPPLCIFASPEVAAKATVEQNMSDNTCIAEGGSRKGVEQRSLPHQESAFSRWVKSTQWGVNGRSLVTCSYHVHKGVEKFWKDVQTVEQCQYQLVYNSCRRSDQRSMKVLGHARPDQIVYAVIQTI